MKQDKVTPEDKAIVAVDPNQIPEELLILPLSDLVAFPTLNMSLAVPLKSLPILEEAMQADRLIGVVGSSLPADEIQLPGELCETGTVVRILYVSRAADSSILVIINGLKRFRVTRWIPNENRLKAEIELAPEVRESDLDQGSIYPPLTHIREVSAIIAKEVAETAYAGELATVPRPDDLLEHIRSHMFEPNYQTYI